MDNDSKNTLMQYLYRFADHFSIEGNSLVSFKKREALLDQLKQKDHNAYVIIQSLFDAFLKADRIVNDKEKYEKARTLWDAEHAAAEKEKVNAEMQLIGFCKEHHIPVGALSTGV